MTFLTLLFVFGLEVSLLEIILVVAVGIVTALISVGVIGKRLAPVAREFNEAIQMYRKVKSADSAGGEQMTKAEKEKLREEALDIFVSAWEQYGSSILGWFTQKVAGMFKRKE